MPLALTVEDGSNVAGANSYATLDQIKAYNAQRAVTLPSTDDAIIAQATAAMDYLATYEFRLAGRRTYGIMQPLAWPRSGVKALGSIVNSFKVPPDIVSVQCYLSGVASDLDLYGNQDTRAIVKDVIGPIETDYSATAGGSYGPLLPTVFAMLRPYLASGGGAIRSVRV